MTRDNASRRENESGLAMVAFLALLLPLIGLLGAAMLAMGGRSARLMSDVRQEKALLAAEAGVDEARHRAVLGTLADGVAFFRELPGGANFTVQPTHLLVDGISNDADTDIDEADEDVFMVEVTAEYGGARRRIAAYLSPQTVALPIEAAITIFHQTPDTNITFDGVGFITGNDTNMDGSPGPAPAVPGIAVQEPATVSDLTSNYSVDDDSRITGIGVSPSLGVSSTGLDVAQLVTDVQTNADVTLSGSYSGAAWGAAPGGPFLLLYRNGDLTLSGTCVGAGILVVDGKLHVSGNFQFDGIIVVLDDLDLADYCRITGAIVQGVDSDHTDFEGPGIEIRYSSQAITAASAALGGSAYTALTGWQEVSRN